MKKLCNFEKIRVLTAIQYTEKFHLRMFELAASDMRFKRHNLLDKAKHGLNSAILFHTKQSIFERKTHSNFDKGFVCNVLK